MESLVSYRMPLYLMEDSIEFLPVIELKVNDVGIRCMSDVLKVLCVDGKEDILHSETIDVARDKTCPADSLDGCLVADLTDRAFQFNVFHRL